MGAEGVDEGGGVWGWDGAADDENENGEVDLGVLESDPSYDQVGVEYEIEEEVEEAMNTSMDMYMDGDGDGDGDRDGDVDLDGYISRTTLKLLKDILVNSKAHLEDHLATLDPIPYTNTAEAGADATRSSSPSLLSLLQLFQAQSGGGTNVDTGGGGTGNDVGSLYSELRAFLHLSGRYSREQAGERVSKCQVASLKRLLRVLRFWRKRGGIESAMTGRQGNGVYVAADGESGGGEGGGVGGQEVSRSSSKIAPTLPT